MTSWRDGASEEAQQDLDGLLEPVLGFAQQSLDRYGEFYPFGATVDLTGEIAMIAGATDSDRPGSADVLNVMLDGLRQRSDLRAAALVADVRTSDSDAIRVELEHREGHAITVLLPYKKRRLGRGIDYKDLSAGAGTRQIWP